MEKHFKHNDKLTPLTLGKKNICLFQVSALKKLGMVGRNNILFCQIILEIAFFSIKFSLLFSKFDNTLLIIHTKMFRVRAKT